MNETGQPGRQLTSWFIKPVASIQEPERRRQARLLSLLLLGLILIGALSVTIDIITGQLVLQAFDDFMPVIGVAALVGVYVLSRTRFYTVSAIVFVGILFIVIHTAPILEPDSPGWLYYAMLPILLSGIFVSLPVLLVVAATSIGSMLLLIGFVPEIEFDLYWLPIMYTTVITVVIVTFMRHRDLVEMDRQAELKRANAAIQESEAKWRSLVKHAPATIFYVDRDGTVEFTNYAEEAGLEDRIGKSIYDYTPPDQHDVIREAINQVLESGEPASYEVGGEAPDGSPVWHSTYVGPIKHEEQVTGLTFITTDVTERVQMEEQREHLHQEIIEAQRQALHELSTPIIPVMDRIIVMPLIGNIDSMRARGITRSLLAGISQHRAKVVILDVTGVSLMDTGIVNHLNKTVQAARLKGAKTIVTGISDAVAEAIVDLGIEWSEITTLSDLQTGLITALAALDLHLERNTTTAN